jgi:ATP-dependent Lon protease
MSRASRMFPREVVVGLSNELAPGVLADTVAQYIQTNIDSKQAIIAERDINKRLLLVLASLEEEKAINALEEKINTKVKKILMKIRKIII